MNDNQEKVEEILSRFDIGDLLEKHAADMTPFFSYAFEALGTESEKEQQLFLSLLEESILKYGIAPEARESVRDTSAFLLFALTGMTELSLSEMICSAPGYVLIRTVSTFIDTFDPEEEGFDPTAVLRWNLLLRDILIRHAAYDAKTDIEEAFLEASLSAASMWYSAENWEEIREIAESTLYLSDRMESLWKATGAKLVSRAMLHYILGTALAEGRGDEDGMKENFRKAVGIIDSLPADMQESLSEIRKASEAGLKEQ